MAIEENAGARSTGHRSRPLPEKAMDAVRCRVGGKHAPRTLERMTAEGVHVKTSVCRKCHCVA